MNTEAETTNSTTSPEKQLLKFGNSHCTRNCSTYKGGNFCSVGPLLALIVIPCSVSMFDMAV